MLSSYGTFQNEEGGMKRFYKSETKRLLMSTNVTVPQRKKNRQQGHFCHTLNNKADILKPKGL